MRRSIPILVLVLAVCASALAGDKPLEKIVVLTNVTIVDVATGGELVQVTVVIKQGRIWAIARRAIIQQGRDIEVVNATGKFLIPGLWELHGRLLGGTDAERARAFFQSQREMERLVAAGRKPLETLQAATIGAARSLGKEKEMGTVEPGKLADLVLLDEDPTDDIRNLDKIAGVVVAGRYYSRRELDAMRARAEAAAPSAAVGP